MIKIVPWADRKLTKKNLNKIWNLFPDEEICMIDIQKDYEKLKWAKMIARYYILRGKQFSIEIDAIKRITEVIDFLKIGVKKFYFLWDGIREGLFFSSLDTLSFSIWITENYKDVDIYIIYSVPYNTISCLPNSDIIETSISFLSNVIKDRKNINGIIRLPHPWFGKKRKQAINNLIAETNKLGNIEVENKCGCLTILPNTNIYCCSFCERKKRKKNFGNADRDKFVCGTIDRGLFRDIQCNFCDEYRR